MADRTVALWRRFAEMFGAEALARKFGENPPPTWNVAIDRLSDFELERGMRRLVYSGKSYIPTLPEFLRMCRESGGDYDGDAKPAPISHQIEHSVPRWMVSANDHLLAYILRRWMQDNVHYPTHALVQPLVDAKNYWQQDMVEAEQRGEIPADHGKKWFEDYIQAAEGIIAGVRERKAA